MPATSRTTFRLRNRSKIFAIMRSHFVKPEIRWPCPRLSELNIPPVADCGDPPSMCHALGPPFHRYQRWRHQISVTQRCTSGHRRLNTATCALTSAIFRITGFFRLRNAKSATATVVQGSEVCGQCSDPVWDHRAWDIGCVRRMFDAWHDGIALRHRNPHRSASPPR
jgi:hypothetical protein